VLSLLVDGGIQFVRLLTAGNSLQPSVLDLLDRLVITAEFAELMDKGEDAFRNAMVELGLLTLMILVLVASIRVLKTRRVRASRV